MNHKILFTLFGLFCCNIITDIAAQTFEKRGFPQERLSPELTAKKKTEQMDKLLQLSEKQFKKIFKLNLKEAKSIDVQRKNRQGIMPPPMPDRNQDKFPDRPPMRNFFNEVPMRPHPQPLQNPEKLKKETRKREKKLKKILTEEQYNTWKEYQKSIQDYKHHNNL